MNVYLITNDNYLWCLRSFTYLFNRYWSASQPVTVVGYNPPNFALPLNFTFHSLGRRNAPQDEWSNGLIKFLHDIKDDFGIILLEDYWISRPVDVGGINLMLEYMHENPYVLRFDLTGDVSHNKGDCRDAVPYGFIGHYDIVQKPPGSQYRMSFQPAIWNNKLLLSLLTPHKDPWQVEMYTEIPDHILILGTKQWPYRMVNAVFKGKIDWAELKKMHPDDYKIVETTIPSRMKE